MSKLAALAAKRRQKENQTPQASHDSESATAAKDDYAASLSKLKLSSSVSKQTKDDAKPVVGPTSDTSILSQVNLDDPNPAHANISASTSRISMEETAEVDLHASPSPFAKALLGASHEDNNTLLQTFQLPTSDSQAFDFSRPSPDDVVHKAQTAKGWT